MMAAEADAPSRMRPPAAEPSDGELVERALAGDALALEALVRRYMRAAYVIALAVLREPATAEDVAQEAVAVAVSQLATCREPHRFAAWLARIVRNRALNARRVLGRERLRFGPVPVELPAREEDGPERSLARVELRERLVRALGALNDVQREVVLLHDLEGWSHREIADALGVTEVNSRQHLFVARRALRKRLALDDGPQDER